MHEAARGDTPPGDDTSGEQLALVRARVRAARPKPIDPPAAGLPVAVVALDVLLAHLDRPFHYLVPEGMSGAAVPGARVRARIAGREVDGFVLERRAASDYGGRLERLRRVVSPEPVLTPEVVSLARAVADRYAGSLADVLRLAVPPRHARAEAEEGPDGVTDDPVPAPSGVGIARYPAGTQLLDALERGESPRVVWSMLPGPRWAEEIADLVVATVRSGRGALVLAPDARDVTALDQAVTAALGPGRSVVLTAGLGPAERYRRFLAVSRRRVRVVVGTRAAAFAPVADLGLVVVWDDGDSSHAEQRAPYPHAREVAVLRATPGEGHRPPALVLAGHSVSAEGALLVARGWARALRPDRSVVRAVAPRVIVPGSEPGSEDPLAAAARIPTAAWRVAREALDHGPVLVHVPRRGYLTRLACRRCRTLSTCPACSGPLALPAPLRTAADTRGDGPKAGHLRCGWCARLAADWRCPVCGSPALRALRVGAERTAEELGKAFPRTRVVQSTGERPRTRVPDRPALVVATPGVEPVADGGYAAALLLDADLALLRPALRAHEDALRRWLAAAALVRGATEGGVVVVAGDPAARPVQHLVRWDPWSAAEAELRDREPLALPPTARVATLTGPLLVVQDAAGELAALLRDMTGSGNADVTLGSPLELDGPDNSGAPDAERPARVLVRARRHAGPALSASLAVLQARRSARRAPGGLRVHVDPLDLA